MVLELQPFYEGYAYSMYFDCLFVSVSHIDILLYNVQERTEMFEL